MRQRRSGGQPAALRRLLSFCLELGREPREIGARTIRDKADPSKERYRFIRDDPGVKISTAGLGGYKSQWQWIDGGKSLVEQASSESHLATKIDPYRSAAD